MTPPRLDQNLGIRQAVKDFAVEEFVAKRPVEALVITVFPRRSRHDIERLDVDPSEPFPNRRFPTCYGTQLAALLVADLDQVDPALAVWFQAECACPSTMVDRIVPATTATNRPVLEAAIGMRDEAAVQTEPFRRLVIEDRFAGPRPRWEAGGAQFVAKVRPYEISKLRMLNGAHSALAHLGTSAASSPSR